MTKKIDEIYTVLNGLKECLGDLIGSAIIRTNGLAIAEKLPEGSDNRRISAMAAALLGTSRRSAEVLGSGKFNSMNLELENGNMFLIDAGKVILILITKKEPNIGLVTLEMEEASDKIKKIMEDS